MTDKFTIISNDETVVKGKDLKIIKGRICKPHNDLMSQEVGGDHKSIHDDETAAKVGFKGAPIHGTVHWSQFTPLLLKVFGKKWFENGNISVHFLKPVTHLEPCRVYCVLPKSTNEKQTFIWMEKEDGQRTIVLKGTASCGIPYSKNSMVQKRISKIKPLSNATKFVLMNFKIGEKSKRETNVGIYFGKKIGVLFPYTIENKNKIITEPHDWFTKKYGGNSPWGRPILAPELLNAICFYTVHNVQWLEGGYTDPRPIGLFGGCEINIINGPVFPNKMYDLQREVVALGETRGTEYVWVKTTLYNAGTNEVVCTMLLQNLSLKRSVDTYQQEREAAENKIRSRI
eukprot:378024_1